MDVRTRQAEIYDGARRAFALSVLYELKINDILNKQDKFMTSIEITDNIEGKTINPLYLERLLRYLACFDVVDELYTNNGIMFKTTEFLKLSEIKLMPFLFGCSAKYLDLLEGKTSGKTLFEHAYGLTVWQHLTKEPHSSNFNTYMSALSSQVMPFVPMIVNEIKAVQGDEFIILDVGGSTGYMMKAIKDHLPKVRCINFDLPHVIERVLKIDGVEMISGDMFNVETLPKCDVIFTKNILHDHPDDKCILILKNFRATLKDDGLLLSINYHLPEQGEIGYPNWLNRSMDITMMELFTDSKERTQKEYSTLHDNAGFKVIRYVVLGPPENPVALLMCKKITS